MEKRAKHGKNKVPFLQKRAIAIIFVFVFGLVGGSILILSHAATPVNNVIEAEDGTVAGNATTPADRDRKSVV